MARFGYYNEDLLKEHEAEEKRRLKLQKGVMSDWKVTAKTIREETEEDMLHKEARREAVTIIEDAARTPDEYDRVTILWDCVEIVEGWRISKQEPKRTELLIEHELTALETVIPAPLNHVYWRQLLGGNFHDVIFDCPHEIQEMTSSRSVCEFTGELDENQKEIFYYWAIRLWSPQKIAEMRGQTDRNIRKVYNLMIYKIRKKMFERLYPRYEKKQPLTFTQREFIQTCLEQNFLEEIDGKKDK